MFVRFPTAMREAGRLFRVRLRSGYDSPLLSLEFERLRLVKGHFVKLPRLELYTNRVWATVSSFPLLRRPSDNIKISDESIPSRFAI